MCGAIVEFLGGVVGKVLCTGALKFDLECRV